MVATPSAHSQVSDPTRTPSSRNRATAASRSRHSTYPAIRRSTSSTISLGVITQKVAGPVTPANATGGLVICSWRFGASLPGRTTTRTSRLSRIGPDRSVSRNDSDLAVVPSWTGSIRLDHGSATPAPRDAGLALVGHFDVAPTRLSPSKCRPPLAVPTRLLWAQTASRAGGGIRGLPLHPPCRRPRASFRHRVPVTPER